MREMKDSGIEWIEKIPNDWEICKFKNVCKIFTGNSISDGEKEQYEDACNAHPYIATKDIDPIFCKPDYQNGMYIKNTNLTFRTAPKGSTLMCIEGGSAGKKKARINQDVSFVNKLCCFYSETQDNNFLYYYLSSPNYEKEFRNNLSGLIGGVSVSILKNIDFVLPPLAIQHSIADYLDNKCSKIDAIIEREQAVIEKLKEYKLSVITEAVTKGLNPNVEMKDSGIEWIGDVPIKWTLSKVGTFCFVTKLAGFEYTDVMVNRISSEDVIPIVRAQNVRMFRFEDEKISEFIDESTSRELQRCALYKRCILITFIGAGIGDVCIFDKTERYHLAPNVAKIEVRGEYNSTLIDEYLMFYLGSYAGKGEIYKISKASAQPSLSMATIRGIRITLPTIAEQLEIVDYLNGTCKKIDAVLNQKQLIIDKLTEYKKSLIYEVVTGKKEV